MELIGISSVGRVCPNTMACEGSFEGLNSDDAAMEFLMHKFLSHDPTELHTYAKMIRKKATNEVTVTKRGPDFFKL